MSNVPGSLIVLCFYILSGTDVCLDVHVYEHTCGSKRIILVVPTQAQIFVASSGATYLLKMLSYIRLFILVCVCVMYMCACHSTHVDSQTTCGVIFPLGVMWVLGTEFSCWTW